MKCRRAFDADLTAVVRGEVGDPVFAAHVVECPDCDAEVRVWRELDGLLRAGAPAGAGAAHPEPDVLVALVDAPATLAGDQRAEVERHVGVCRVCADEVRSLRRLDAGALAAQAAAPSRDATAQSDAAPLRRDRLARVVWHPAFAYALLALALVPLVREQLPHVPRETRLADARREAPAAPAPAPQPVAPPAGQAEGRMRRAESKLDERAAANEQPSARAKRAVPEEPEVEGAPSLQDLAGTVRGETDARDTAALAAAARPLAPSERTVVELRTRASTTIPYALGARGVVLRIVPPADARTGPLDVRVRGRAGSRELAQRVAEPADAIAVAIPPDWLVPGDYVVTLTPADGAAPGRRATEPVTLGFTVRAPTAAEAQP